MNQQEYVVGSKAEREDKENNKGQSCCSLFLGCLRISGQFAYDTDIAEHCDTEREEEEEEHHTEDKGRPGCGGREHIFLQHVKACGDPKCRNIKGQICGHQRVQYSQDQCPHHEAADDSRGLLLPGLSELHGFDYAKVAANSNSHHGQDGAVHVGVEDKG